MGIVGPNGGDVFAYSFNGGGHVYCGMIEAINYNEALGKVTQLARGVCVNHNNLIVRDHLVPSDGYEGFLEKMKKGI